MTGKVNAVVSGQSGVAILSNAGELASLHAGRGTEVVRRHPSEARFLLGDAMDLHVLENVEINEVSWRLELATAQMDALHVALILLDGSLSGDIRQEAAGELQELMEDEAVSVYVESVLYAHPLPSDADLSGALAACTPETEQTRSFLQRLGALQQHITQVHYAWQGIPTPVFGTEKDRGMARSVAVREGLFRALVLREAEPAPIDPSWIDALLKSKGLSREIALAWAAPLREYPVYRSESLFVAESIRPLRSSASPTHARLWTSANADKEETPGRRVVGVLVTYTWRPEGEIFPVLEGRNFVGRSAECEIHISTDPQMSARHACIIYKSDSFWIEDELSVSGTFLNGEPVEEKRRLPSSAVVRTGGTVWRFTAVEQPPEE